MTTLCSEESVVFLVTMVVMLEYIDDDPIEHKCALNILSHVEILHALFQTFDADMGPGVGPAVLCTHRSALLCMRVRIVVCTTKQAMHFYTVNQRSTLVGLCHVVKRTVQQHIFDVIDSRSQLILVAGSGSASIARGWVCGCAVLIVPSGCWVVSHAGWHAKCRGARRRAANRKACCF